MTPCVYSLYFRRLGGDILPSSLGLRGGVGGQADENIPWFQKEWTRNVTLWTSQRERWVPEGGGTEGRAFFRNVDRTANIYTAPSMKSRTINHYNWCHNTWVLGNYCGKGGEYAIDHHHYHHHHNKHQGLDPLIRSVSRVIAARANASSVFQLFFFLVVCSGMIWKGFGFVAFYVLKPVPSVFIYLV